MPLAILISTKTMKVKQMMTNKHKLTPQSILLPTLREAKGTRMDTRIKRKNLSEFLCQRVGGFDEVQPITDDGKNEISALCARGWLCDESITRMPRHQRTNTQRPVPEAGVVGTDISDINQSVEPRDKNGIANSKGGCHIPFRTSWLQVLIENRHRAERCDFQCYPTGRQRIAVFSPERPNKLFVAALKFIMDTCQSLCMLRRIGEKARVTKPVAIMSQRHDIGHLGADCNFDALNSGENYMSQMTVEFIEYPCLFKGTARFKDVILSVCQKRIPITAHSIVTDFVEPFFCFLFVGYHQTTLLQDANLISKRLNMLGIWYLVHNQIIKKAHPKRAVLREAG